MKKNNISKIVACISITLVVGVVIFFALKNAFSNDISEEKAIIIAKKYVEEYIEKEKAKGVTYVAQDFSTYKPSVKINHKGDKDYWRVSFSKTSDDSEVFEPYSYVCELCMNGDLSYVDKSK